ncbi:hypothetical protein P8918_13715 [Bacillus spizizenii]|nr:hypothetical protein [Bacillus spizizenii]MCY8890362.1 hypothetical protein [Bacillus spizizenii]MEC0842086.1 hypothetical protein [Bacillus spizizenii]
MSFQRDQLIIFAGKKTTVQDLLVSYDMQEESDQSIQIILEKLVKKGSLRVIQEEEPGMKEFKSVAKEIDLEARIAQMTADAEQAEAYKTMKRKEGRLSYEEVEIDFPTMSYANEFKQYATDKLRVQAEVRQGDGVYVLVLKDVSETDLSAIKHRKNFTEAGKLIYQSTDKLADSAIQATSFATEKVVVPTFKAVNKTTLGLAKSLVKTGAQIGSSMITSGSQNARSMSSELSKDEDVLRAKKELTDAKDAMMRLFRRGGKSSPGIRVK